MDETYYVLKFLSDGSLMLGPHREPRLFLSKDDAEKFGSKSIDPNVAIPVRLQIVDDRT